MDDNGEVGNEEDLLFIISYYNGEKVSIDTLQSITLLLREELGIHCTLLG